MDGTREVQRQRRRAAVDGSTQRRGSGPQPAVLVQSLLEGCGELLRDTGNQQGQRRAVQRTAGHFARQAEPAERRQRKDITLGLEPRANGING
jgi:hypothetical protein